MSDMNINQVLAQMRSMSIEASSKPQEVENDSKVEFSTLLKQSINGVNQTQQTAAKMAQDFELGERDVSLAEVMISAQKANVSFQAMVQVRNKLVDAYKEVMNMPM